MLEDRQHNALAALDIFQNVIRADSLSGDVARWQRAFDEAKRANDPRKPPVTPTPQQRADGTSMFVVTLPGGRKEEFWNETAANNYAKRMGGRVEEAIGSTRADATPVACTFILVDGSVDQVIPHTGAWQSIVAREVRDLKNMDCGKVTTKEYADETIGYARHDSVRKDASPLSKLQMMSSAELLKVFRGQHADYANDQDAVFEAREELKRRGAIR